MSNPFGDEDDDAGFGSGFGGKRSNGPSGRSSGYSGGNRGYDGGGGNRGYDGGGGSRGYSGGGGSRGYSGGGEYRGSGYRGGDDYRGGGDYRGGDNHYGGGSGFGGGGGSGFGGGGGFGGDGRGGGYSSGYSGGRPDPDDYETRMMLANRRMEQSSAHSLRVLNETLQLGNETSEELERQAEVLDRTERTLDEMHQDIDIGEKHLRKIKSPFGGVYNIFSRKKPLSEVTDPKGCKKPPKSKASGSSAKSSVSKDSRAPAASTGNAVVDRNLDEMEKALFQLKGVGELIGDQLDDSEVQLDRLGRKLERNDVKIQKLNKGIKKEL